MLLSPSLASAQKKRTKEPPAEKIELDEDDDGVTIDEKTGEPKVAVQLEEEPPKSESTAPKTEPGPPKPSPFDVSLAGGVTHLAYEYNQPISDAASRSLLARPSTPITLRVAGHWYPAAHFTGGALAHVGLAVSVYQSVGGSIFVDQQEYALGFSERNFGLRGRIPTDSVELGINAGYGMQSLIVGDNTNQSIGLFPDMQYNYFRFGPDLHWSLGGFMVVDLGAYYRLISIGTGPGELGESRWFPHAVGDGFELQLGGSFPLALGLSAFVRAEFRNYGLAMNSKASDRNQSAIAGGATDQYLSGFAGIEWKLEGDN